MHPYLKRPWQKKKTFQTFQAQNKSLRISENYRNNHRHCRLKFNPSSSCVCTRRVYRLAFRWEIDRSFCVYNIGWRVGTWLVLWPWTGYSNQDACAAGFDHLTSRDPCIASSLSLSFSLSPFLPPSLSLSFSLPRPACLLFYLGKSLFTFTSLSSLSSAIRARPFHMIRVAGGPWCAREHVRTHLSVSHAALSR